jgi:hypothetical protein
MGIPLATFEVITEQEMNACLIAWGHKMGPLSRPMAAPHCYGLRIGDEVQGVVSDSSLIPEELAGQRREDTIEVSRLCASQPSLCRVTLRLWREVAFPLQRERHAISYQDERLHTGNTYRFDGWRVLTRTRSGLDRRSDRAGRNKTVWIWSKSS